MGFEYDSSSADSRADTSRRVATIIRLGGHMRVLPGAGNNNRFRAIEVARAAKLVIDDRLLHSSSTFHEEHAGVEGSSVIEHFHDRNTNTTHQPEESSDVAPPEEI